MALHPLMKRAITFVLISFTGIVIILLCTEKLSIQLITRPTNMSLILASNKSLWSNASALSHQSDDNNDSSTAIVQSIRNHANTGVRLVATKQTEHDDVKLIRGIKRREPGYLTIGLCSVPREKVSYLQETVHSLIEKMSDEEKDKVVIVLFLGSFEETWLNQTFAFIDEDFSKEISRGLLQVVQPNPEIYPDFKQITKRTYDDEEQRVYWRVKQNIDFAYLFGYCAKLNKYYIHVEDDIIAASDYIKDIQKFVAENEKTQKLWFMIDFCKLGFIGKLFKSSELQRMKTYFLLFQEEKPCDILISDMTNIMTQFKPIRSIKSLFQHRGLVSSLKNKVQRLTDNTFKDKARPQGYKTFFVLNSKLNSKSQNLISAGIL